MHQLIYSSVASKSLNSDDLTYLIEQSRINNEYFNITGLLLFYNCYFFQVLEGENEILKKLYLKISNDKRHSEVTLLEFEPLDKRRFSQWRLGIANFSSQKPFINLKQFVHYNVQLTLEDKKCFQPLIDSFAKGINRFYVN